MDFKNTFSKIKKTAVDTASTVAQSAKESSAVVAKKSGELIEISKLTVSINSNESKMKDLYSEIGKKVFEKHENGQYIDPELVENCNEILALKTSINEMKQNVNEIRNKKICTNCDTSLSEDTAFCPKCGNKIDSLSFDEVEIIDPEKQD
ncbi:MAG: zinc-ribbon domain-containing protein [Clostridium sp.]|nr:zinc-ribbon domain-containing protein [Clostridium sp.]